MNPLHPARPAPGAPAAPPPKIWLDLGHSTLDARAPDWAWLRRQCRGGRLLATLAPVRRRIRGLVVPVFGDARCFYATSLPLFRDRNPEASADEAALRDLLKAARSAGIPVYLGVDALGWQKGHEEDKTGVLARRPELREAGYGGFEVDTPSPFHPEVRKTLRDLTRELAQRFPDAAGLAVDLRMSERSIDGFSPSARAQFALQSGLDPLDFRLDNIVELRMNDMLRAWVDWRRKSIAGLVGEMTHSYKAARTAGKVLVNGYADYYVNRDFSDIRTAQDWLGWAGSTGVDGVLLEGRWLAPFQDIDQIGQLRERLAGIGKRAGRQISLVPLSAGPHLIRTADYAAEWNALARRGAGLDTFALLARNDEDLQQAVRFAQGALLPKRTPSLRVGAPLPDFQLARASGPGAWNSKSPRGKRSVDLYVVADPALLTPLTSALSGTAAPRTTERVVVAAGSGAVRGVPSGVTFLSDPRRAVLSRFEGGVTRVQIDRAGYVRDLERLPANAAALRAAAKPHPDATPPVAEGRPAPEFTAYDAVGQEIRLSDYRGRNPVLITFFPKCFTDG